MKKKSVIKAALGFLSLSFILFVIHVIDLAVLYSIFLYFQFLLAPLLTGVGFFFYILRLSLPYICMYILICLFFNIQSYRTNSTIKLLKYTIDINAAKKTKLYIYIRQYNYVLIIVLNLLLLFIVYYAYINNKYFYLLFVFLFYLSIWIVIKIKRWLLKNEALQYKKVHMLVNLILVVLIGTYISMALDEFHISNGKLFGLENFWKLIDNKFFIKMPPTSKDLNWNRLFYWSKQGSTDRYMSAIKNSLAKTESLSEEQKFLGNSENVDLYVNDKVILSQSIKNEEINLKANLKLAYYLNRTQYENQNLSKFTNALYQKFKKVFLLQIHIKSHNFLPTSEITERHKLLHWLKKPYNFIDLSKYYAPAKSTDTALYDNYIDLVDKKFNNLMTKKVFLITYHKDYISLKRFAFYADFESSFKKNYALFLNSEKNNIDFKNNSLLNFEYYNTDLYLNFKFNNLWELFKNELYIVFKENKLALTLITMKFKSLYTIKKFSLSFREDVLEDDDKELLYNLKLKKKNYIMIPDFKKLQVWRTFKLNYKEIIFKHTIETKKFRPVNYEDKWLLDHKIKKLKEPLNEIFFVFEDDIAYSLSDNKLTQVEDLIFNELNLNEEYDALNEYIAYYLENIKGRTTLKTKSFASNNKFTKILISDLEKAIIELQSHRVHVSTFNSMYHEILFQNSNKFFKNIIENYTLSRDLLTSSRSLMTFDMWCIAMQKLLNLNTESFCLNNLKDFSDFCKSDFTDDLEYNFSLAFNIMQTKYDLNKFLLIPDLEGVPGLFYEYTVKYNALMEKTLWYEEQEALIDWVYEISYYALVNIMDTVKEVDGKENDFLFDMINQYLREPQYKWAAELFDEGLTEKPTEQMMLLNRKLAALNDIYDIYDFKEKMRLIDYGDLKYIPSLHNKALLDFDNIENLEQLNYKIDLDIHVLDKLFKWQIYHIAKSYDVLTDDLATLHHDDYHDEVFDLLGQFYSQAQEEYSWDLGALGSVGLHSDHIVVVYHDDYLDDSFELKNMEKLDYFYEEIDTIMFFEYEKLIETEEFENWLAIENYDLQDEFKFFVLTYKEEVQLAHIRILNKMLCDINIRKNILLDNDIEFADARNELHKLNLEIQELKCIEYRNMYLDKLPIFNWYTYSYIDENVELLFKENKNILAKKLIELDNLLDKEKLKFVEIKKAAKSYGVRIVKHAMDEPSTKRYLEKNWDDYNYLSNKSDKLMRDWYKIGKKK